MIIHFILYLFTLWLYIFILYLFTLCTCVVLVYTMLVRLYCTCLHYGCTFYIVLGYTMIEHFNIILVYSMNVHFYIVLFMLCMLQVSEECSTLRLSLSAAQHERESAKEQVTSLQTQVNSLENLVKVGSDSRWVVISG